MASSVNEMVLRSFHLFFVLLVEDGVIHSKKGKGRVTKRGRKKKMATTKDEKVATNSSYHHMLHPTVALKLLDFLIVSYLMCTFTVYANNKQHWIITPTNQVTIVYLASCLLFATIA